jgi:hypothetical protein
MSKFLEQTGINIFNQTKQNSTYAETKNLRGDILTAKNASFNQISDEVKNRLNLSAPTYKQLSKSADLYKNITALDLKLLPEEESQKVINFLKRTASQIHKDVKSKKLRNHKEAKKEKLLECLKILDTTIEVKPNNDWLHFDRGLCQLDLAYLDSKSSSVNLNLAIEDFTAEIALGESKKNKEQIYDSYHQRAKCYYILGLSSKSLNDAQNAIELSKNDNPEFAKELEKLILKIKKEKEREIDLEKKKQEEINFNNEIINIFSLVGLTIFLNSVPTLLRNINQSNSNSKKGEYLSEKDAQGMLKILVDTAIVDSGFLDKEFFEKLGEEEKKATLKLFDILQQEISDSEKLSKIKDYLKSKLDEESSINPEIKDQIIDNFSSLEEMAKTINLNGRQKNYLYNALLKNSDSQKSTMNPEKLLEVRKKFFQECEKALKEGFQNEISIEEGSKTKIENSQTLENGSPKTSKNEQNDLENIAKKEDKLPNSSPEKSQAMQLSTSNQIKFKTT